MSKMREEFSRWVLTHPDNLDITSYEENIMFDAWQAAKAQAVPEGYVLVPKEPTQKMVDAGSDCFCFPLDNGRFSDWELHRAYVAMIESEQEQTND